MLDDLRSEVVVRLLQRMRESPADAAPIGSFDGYIAGIASRVVDDAMRVACPEWMRLKHRVRYLVTHDGRFRLAAESSTVSLAEGMARVHTAAAEELAKRVADLVTTAGGELGIDTIVSALAEREGVGGRTAPWHDRVVDSPAATAESADTLHRLWDEIALLPPRQRAALLLNARDAGGESVLRLLASAGLMSSREAASALDVGRRELAVLLDELPLHDQVIARRLGVTPQQVINLRKAARDRLARRLARRR